MKPKQLRNGILHLAITGKLVKQNPNDEPASVLLEKIRAEKQKLIKEGKIKKDKNESVIFRGEDGLFYEKIGKEVKCINDELPFEIPDSWQWVRLGSVCSINGGFAFKSIEFTETGVRVIRISDFNEKGFVNKNIVRYKYNDTFSDFLIKEGDILLCMTGGTVGKSYFVKKIDEPMAVNQRVAKINSYICKNKFIYYILIGAYIQNLVQANKNSTNDNISINFLSNLLIPLPPLEEQKRIAEKLDVIMPLIDIYDENYTELEKLDREFPSKMKKSILQEAIQGKLVKQNPNDEPASVLLEKIRAEKQKLIKEGKIKKDKNESVIFCKDGDFYEKFANGEERCINEEIPFEIPSSWEWVRLGIVFQHNTGKALNSSNQTGKLFKYITTSNVYWNYFQLDSLKEMYFTESEIEKCTVKKGDLLVCEGGDVGRSAIWSFDYNICIQNHIHRLRSYIPVITKFYYYILYFYKNKGLIQGQGITIKGLSSNMLHNTLIPLPPLEEQKRIVAKIEEIFKELEPLEEK